LERASADLVEGSRGTVPKFLVENGASSEEPHQPMFA